MMKMRKKLLSDDESLKQCRNCAYGLAMADDEKILCEKSGIRYPDSVCKKFKYDPLSRIPKKQPELSDYSEEDFAL